MHFTHFVDYRRHARHFGYYNIEGTLFDGYSYVLYLNGGHPALSLCNTLLNCGAMLVKPWKLLWKFLCRASSRF
uniref:Uncharacterized protein n=1 Tax=Romanomermis culicivorax TaxID=13658 RepID=A0A915IS37_ROMCU